MLGYRPFRVVLGVVCLMLFGCGGGDQQHSAKHRDRGFVEDDADGQNPLSDGADDQSGFGNGPDDGSTRKGGEFAEPGSTTVAPAGPSDPPPDDPGEADPGAGGEPGNGAGGSSNGGRPDSGGGSAGSSGSDGSGARGGDVGGVSNGGSGNSGSGSGGVASGGTGNRGGSGNGGTGNRSGSGSGGNNGGTAGGSSGGGSAGNSNGPEACRCADPDCGSCPTNPVVETGQFGIDATEVTKSAYAAYLATKPDPNLQIAQCAWNTSFVPTIEWPPGIDGEFPVVAVDWCDAYAYCRWARKRLCGRIGGGSNLYGDFAKAEESQWYNACSNGGQRPYPYGDNYGAKLCNGDEYGFGSTKVGSIDTCEGGYAELYDMSGNVWEWEDSCAADEGREDLCRRRGGSHFSTARDLQCSIGGFSPRDEKLHYVGFRCCVD